MQSPSLGSSEEVALLYRTKKANLMPVGRVIGP